MKILFWGRGVVGTQYAWALEKAGHTVEFYVREGRKAIYGTSVSLEILDARRNKKDRLVKEEWPVVLHENIAANHDYDIIFVSVNPEQIPDSVKYLAPRIGKATVLFIGNFWRDTQKAAEPIPPHQVVWGFPGAGGGMEGNHLYGGLYKSIHFGILDSAPTKRDLALHSIFTDAGFKVSIHKDFQSFLKNHFISNVAMEMEVLRYGSFKAVASSREALTNVGRNTQEMVSVLRANNIELDGSTRLMSALPPRAVGLLMSIVFSPNSAASALMAHNHYNVGPAVREIISEVKSHGIKAPRILAMESFIQE